MNPDSINKKQCDAHLTLYRLLRLQNRENNFIFRDAEAETQLRVSYQHFPLETIGHGDLLKTFWKFITTHYFKKIDQEELYRLNYIRNLFSNRIILRPSPSLRQLHLPLGFFAALKDLFQPSYLQQVYVQYEDSIDGRIHLKNLYLGWAGVGHKIKKEKKIRKGNKKDRKPQAGRWISKSQMQMYQRQKDVDKMIEQLQLSQGRVQQQQGQKQLENIDDEIARLESLLQDNAEANLNILQKLESSLCQEEKQVQDKYQDILNRTDVKCLQWLIHNLEQKQIAQSVAKIITSERKDSQSKFIIHYEKALNLNPQLVSQRSLKKMNQLRQTSLLKFYRTAVKSTHSYICHNYAGFIQMKTHYSSLQKNKEKDQLQMMKKMGPAPHDIRQSMEQFDICHHCKFLYLPQFLVTCKFVSDRPCMPKISESETDFAQDLSLQKGRVSQRFVAKHRNCMTGYARINEQFVCGRKFCLSCLKDNYGENWMRSNNGICPFCEGICSCTRCLRNEKMNKLKAFFLSLGGDLNKLQDESLIDKLSDARDELALKASYKPKKSLKSLSYTKCKQIKKKFQKTSPHKQAKNNRRYLDKSQKKSVGSQELEKWSSTAEKEVQKTIIWRRSSRRYTPTIY